MIDLEGRVSPVYEGSGTVGPFSFPFKVWKTDQVAVAVKESEDAVPRLLGPSEFTVSLGEDKGGTVTLNVPLATGGKLVILSDIPYLQSVALENMGLFNPEDLEKAWDTNTALIQQLKEKLDRAVLAPLFGETPEEPVDGFERQVLDFLDFTAEEKVPVIIRHVIVKGFTDSPKELEQVGKLLARYPNIKGLEVLPYHNMGEQKYESLKLPYPLKGMENLSQDEAAKARKIILESFQQHRSPSSLS